MPPLKYWTPWPPAKPLSRIWRGEGALDWLAARTVIDRTPLGTLGTEKFVGPGAV
jgi:hypothetical protein